MAKENAFRLMSTNMGLVYCVALKRQPDIFQCRAMARATFRLLYRGVAAHDTTSGAH